ncbi:hypothetical protein F4821DRAFT_44429 [Hypoxylon rubiginosum]|uniref:Uncharacterized protein n=1 Tax=Hypoxylon rubiginosum TaxID=110542 RepID=A0ACC0DAX4_9PEZI|nr:hypothetical protein F4821DRAFT_44429 [Hypoxylon rubiginosum]
MLICGWPAFCCLAAAASTSGAVGEKSGYLHLSGEVQAALKKCGRSCGDGGLQCRPTINDSRRREASSKKPRCNARLVGCCDAHDDGLIWGRTELVCARRARVLPVSPREGCSGMIFLFFSSASIYFNECMRISFSG